jgi:hypothetical protein
MWFTALAVNLSPLFAAAATTRGHACNLQTNFFFFVPSWWEYLKIGKFDALGVCQPTVNLPNDLLAIGMAVLDMMLRLASFVAVIAIIIAGVTYMFSMGNAEKAAGARRRLYNALIGLGIAITATAAVTFISNVIIK